VSWDEAIRRGSHNERLDRDALRDHMPLLLDRIIECLDGSASRSTDATIDGDVRERLHQGHGLEQVSEEYRVLRSGLLGQLSAEPPGVVEPAVIQLLDETIDDAMAHALDRYHQRRSQMLAALERVSQDAFAGQGEALHHFLRRFLRLIADSIDSVDTAVFYLRERDRILIRAGVGLEASIEGRFALCIGEGIAGTVAATRRPYFTPDAAHDPLTRNPALVKGGVRALCALPMVYGDELLGVAKMGSRTRSGFCAGDRHVFEEMAQRAAVVVAHRRLTGDRAVFLGAMERHLRPSLGTITAAVSQLKQGERLTEPGARAVQRVESAAHDMDGLFADLAEYANVPFGGGGTRIEPRALDLADALREVVGELSTQHPERPIRLGLHGDLRGQWDRARVGQLVTSLVHGAAHYAELAAPVDVQAEGSNEPDVTLSVHAPGRPIPSELRAHLFEPFRRGGEDLLGPLDLRIGLYLARQIASAHGGSVNVESAEERGATFTVRLPRSSDV
jgi:signal transduction histidine kinase